MKKITLNTFLFLLITAFSNVKAQTYSTGMITADANFSFKVDVTSTEVTLTMVGPAANWLAVGFGGSKMTTVSDIVYYTNNANIVDAKPGSTMFSTSPAPDTNNDWTLVSNTNNGGVRTVIATRDLNTGSAEDYIFSNSASSIDFIWAHQNGDNLGYHSSGQRGSTSAGTTLGAEDFTLNDKFSIYPNPSNGIINIKTNDFEASTVSIFDLQGRQVKTVNQFNEVTNPSIDLSDLSKGIYNVIVSSSKGKGFKKILID